MCIYIVNISTGAQYCVFEGATVFFMLFVLRDTYIRIHKVLVRSTIFFIVCVQSVLVQYIYKYIKHNAIYVYIRSVAVGRSFLLCRSLVQNVHARQVFHIDLRNQKKKLAHYVYIN